MEQIKKDYQLSYDRVAEQYAKEYRDEMDKKPFDRKMLDWLMERVGHTGMICDLGCGPGQIADYLHRHGAKVCGIDLSAQMVKQAQFFNPDIPFQQGDMLALTNIADHAFAGIAAFYSIVHIPRPQILNALRELKRVLSSGGLLLLTFHIGQEIIHKDEWWGKQVRLDFIFFETEFIKTNLKEAGFDLMEVIERDPYPNLEFQSRRAYVFAKKP